LLRDAPLELAPWQCGEQRLELRQRFNMKEIDVADIMRRYDMDRNRLLDPGELRQVLQDYNAGRPPRDEELNFIMKIADTNHDQRISQDEVMFALRTWYAFTHMPPSVGHAFTKCGFHGGAMPSVEAFQQLLLTVNEYQPVSTGEAAFVFRTAAHLSGSNSDVTLEQLRQAVAAWYLNIERSDTSNVSMLVKAAQDAHKKAFNLSHLNLLFTGDCNYKAKGTRILGLVSLVVLVVIPCFEIIMADAYPTNWKCEHPHISVLLWSTGVLSLSLGLGLAGAVIATHFNCGAVKIFFWVFACAVAVIICIVTAIGADNVLWSSGGRCGFALWHFAHFMWIEVPVLVIGFLICGLPIMYVVLGSQEFIKAREIDESLLKP